MSVMIELYQSEITTNVDSYWYIIISSIFYVLSGMPIVILRLREPYVMQELLKRFPVCRILCCKVRSKKQKKRELFSSEGKDSLLNSAMNIEYVSLILTGVVGIMDQIDPNVNFETMDSKIIHEEDEKSSKKSYLSSYSPSHHRNSYLTIKQVEVERL